MKRFIFSFLVVALFGVFSTSVFAGECHVRDAVNWHATINSAVFLRSDCPTGDNIGTVPKGEVVQILEVDQLGEFYKVKTSVGTGMLFQSFLTDIVHSPLPGTEVYTDSVFIDLPLSHIYYDEIVNVKEHGIVNGNSDGTIRADDPVNRVELAKILVEAVATDEDVDSAVLSSGVYSDVEVGAWYLPYLAVAKDLGVMNGDGESFPTTVRPGDAANGAEVSKMIVKAFNLDVVPVGGEMWYEPYMTKLKDLDALPYSSPSHVVTRGEMMYAVSILIDSVLDL